MLNKDFREFIELLNSNAVKYLLIGGYAIAFHGHPRHTNAWNSASHVKKAPKKKVTPTP